MRVQSGTLATVSFLRHLSLPKLGDHDLDLLLHILAELVSHEESQQNAGWQVELRFKLPESLAEVAGQAQADRADLFAHV